MAYPTLLGRRADGYHEIVTVFQSIDVADRLTFSTHADDGRITLTYDGAANIPLDETNLVVRAANALRQRYGVRRLEVFGSLLRDDFDHATSDVDLVVEFQLDSAGSPFDRYFGLNGSSSPHK